MQRAVVLEHRRAPRDVNDRLQKLEIRVGEMARVLDEVRAQTDRLLSLENRMEELARKLNVATRNDSLQHLEDISRELDRMQKTINTQTDNLLRLENRMDKLAHTLNVAIQNDSLQHLDNISRKLDRMQKMFIAQTDKLSRLENRMDKLAHTLNVAIQNDSLQHLENISRKLDHMQKTVKAQTDNLSRLENRMDELARTLNVAIRNDNLQHLEHISRELDHMQKTVKAQRNDSLQNLEDISRKLDHRLHLVSVENEKLKREMYFLKSCLKEQCKEDTCDKDNRECPSRPCPTQNCAENVPGCPTHTCDTGKRECPPQDCKEENLPGHCTEQTRSCTHSGVNYNNGDSWRSVESPCDICQCLDGYVRCEREQCYTPCRNPAAPPPNTCCPVCEGCDVNGHEVPNGAVIPVGDPCEECRCENGNMVCSYVYCPAPSCNNPVYHADECCPRCEQCEYESKVYGNGESFTSKSDPCLQCYCSAGEVFCRNMAASCPTSHCTHPARHRGECCATCNACILDEVEYEDIPKDPSHSVTHTFPKMSV
ncbi:kielin/chordin-like protein [Astatotilapia calliptera]|uniref:kielin/chordin-like protein n=1 Tax=Astatotilapia calliptera TaxID=8154 RepID=UPI000E40F8D9|nr:kielin/chordin-like protein [Astatotilapia calliptera]